jgi:hypothetical protein
MWVGDASNSVGIGVAVVRRPRATPDFFMTSSTAIEVVAKAAS